VARALRAGSCRPGAVHPIPANPIARTSTIVASRDLDANTDPAKHKPSTV